MILLQLSSGSGPLECSQAVSLALKKVIKEANLLGMVIELVQAVKHEPTALYKSLLLEVKGPNQHACLKFAASWEGTMLWVSQSAFRPKHKRKNWYFGGRVFTIENNQQQTNIRYETCRASGAGGQHVNTTDSAVRAVDALTGIAVRAESERSQHANKKLATILLYQKLQELEQAQQTAQEKEKWKQHKLLVRGDAARVFKGPKFIAVT